MTHEAGNAMLRGSRLLDEAPTDGCIDSRLPGKRAR